MWMDTICCYYREMVIEVDILIVDLRSITVILERLITICNACKLSEQQSQGPERQNSTFFCMMER